MRARDESKDRKPTLERPEPERPRTTAEPDLSAAALNHLQRSSGNAAVCRALAHRSAAPQASAPRSSGETIVLRSDFTATIGMGPDPAPAPGPRARLTGADAKAGAEKHLDLSMVPPAPPVPEPEPAGASAPAGGESAGAEAEEEFQLPDIVLPELEGGIPSTDAVTSWLGTSGHITRGGIALAGGEFGRTDGGDLRVTNIWVKKIPLMSRYFVKATVEHHVQWDVRVGAGPTGEVNIDSWSSPAITAANYTNVADDLTPDTSDLGGRPPRTAFWAQDITERHEEYHANDMVRHTGPAASLASTWLSAQTAASPAGVNALLTQVPNQVLTAIVASYVPQSEERAYGDGVWAYRQRAWAIRARGAVGGY